MSIESNNENIREKKVVKRGSMWCIIHMHGDKKGTLVKGSCHSNKKDTLRMHRAIMRSEAMRKKYRNPSAITNEELILDLKSLIADYLNKTDYESYINDITVLNLKEIAKRKSENKINCTLKVKSWDSNSVAYQLWKEVKINLENREIAMLIMKPYEYKELTKSLLKSKNLKPGYYSTAKPYYRFELPIIHEDLEKVGWDKEKLLIDTKIDGVRGTLMHINNKGYLFADPDERKHKSPDISNRVPAIIAEIIKITPNNTVNDVEILTIYKNEALHRTTTNGLLNSKIDANKLSPYIYVFVFDVLFYSGKDLRDLPLSERLKYLSKIKSSDHIKIENVTNTTNDGYQGYIVNGNNKKSINKIINNIINDKHGLPKFSAEGIIVKLLSYKYETGANHGFSKGKKFYEIDTIAYDRKLVKGSTNVWNYFLGINITKEYYDKLPNKIKIEHDSKYFIRFGKSDNSKLNIKPSVSTVIRVASEEVNKFENEDHPEAPWYRGYINVVMQDVPEKSISDNLNTLDRLSAFQPKRIPVIELARLKNEKISEKYKNIIEKIENTDTKALKMIKDKLYKINDIS